MFNIFDRAQKNDDSQQQQPRELPMYLVCCHCKQIVVEHKFCCDGHWISSYHCPKHGDTVPIYSSVSNGYAQISGKQPDWSAA